MKLNSYPDTDSLYIDLSHRTGVESRLWLSRSRECESIRFF